MADVNSRLRDLIAIAFGELDRGGGKVVVRFEVFGRVESCLFEKVIVVENHERLDVSRQPNVLAVLLEQLHRPRHKIFFDISAGVNRIGYGRELPAFIELAHKGSWNLKYIRTGASFQRWSQLLEK